MRVHILSGHSEITETPAQTPDADTKSAAKASMPRKVWKMNSRRAVPTSSLGIFAALRMSEKSKECQTRDRIGLGILNVDCPCVFRGRH